MFSGCGQAAPYAPLQRPTRPFRIGTLGPGGTEPKNLAGLVQGMRDLGWLEGRDVVFDHRFARMTEGLIVRVGELIELKVDVIVAAGNGAIHVASAATGAIPIVMALSNDPVGAGLIASIARPGGNVTGVTNLGTELGAKRLQLLKEVAPGTVHGAVVWDQEVLGRAGIDAELSAAASGLGLQLEPHPVGGNQIWDGFAAAIERGADAILLLSDSLAFGLASTGYLGQAARADAGRGCRVGTRRGPASVRAQTSPPSSDRPPATWTRSSRARNPLSFPVEQPVAFDLDRQPEDGPDRSD